MEKNPNKVPLIFERHPDSNFEQADNNIKFFTDRSVEFQKLIDNVREIWSLNEKETLFFTANLTTIINSNKDVGSIYDQYKSEDGFVYIQVNNMKTLG